MSQIANHDLLTEGWVAWGGLKRFQWGRYEICFPADMEAPIEPSLLIDSLGDARSLEKKGRGGIRIANIAGNPVACRKYIHGGLFRGITGDIFFSGKRAIDEFRMMLFLKEKGFSIVSPYCVIVEKRLLTKNLYILTYYKEDANDLTEFLQRATQKERYRAIKRLAELMWQLEKFGVCHPDLHLSNVLVESKTKALLLLDFDRAYRKSISGRDMERMFWRLNRYADKTEREGRLKVGVEEKLLFLRAYGRLSGVDMAGRMAKKAGHKEVLARIGWLFETLLYGKQGANAVKSNKSEIRNQKSEIRK